MHVGEMQVTMGEPVMAMAVGMGRAAGLAAVVLMSVMLVVRVQVVVLDVDVLVVMLVALGEMEPHTQSHQEAGRDEPDRQRFPEQRHR